MSTYSASIEAYLASSNLSETGFAAALGRNQVTINRYRRGERIPDADTARLIDEFTKGQVPFEVWQREFLAKAGLQA